MNQLGPHTDASAGNDLERLAQVIAGALQEEGPRVGTKTGPLPAVQGVGGNQDQDPESNRVPDPTQKASERMKEKGASLICVDERL